MMRAKLWFLVLVAVVAGVLFAALRGTQSRDATQVSLDKTSEISRVWQISGDAFTEPSHDSLRVAIAGVLSPSKTWEDYQELLN